MINNSKIDFYLVASSRSFTHGQIYALTPVYFFIGTTKHEETSWKAMESIFKYFQNQEVDFDEKSEAGKCERNSSDNKNNKKTLLALACTFSKPEITKESNSEKSKEKNPDITTGLLETTNDAKKSKNGTGEDGMDLVVKKHGEAKHGSESAQDGSESKKISDDKEGINAVETSKNTNEESESSEQEYEDDLDEIHEDALKPGQEKSNEFKEVKNKESDHEQSGYSPGQDKKASKHKSSQAEGGPKPAKRSYDKKRSNKKEKRWLKKKVIKAKKASEKSKSNEQKSENAIDEDVMKHESGISDECRGVDSKSAGHEQSGHDEKNEYKESEKALTNTQEVRGNDAIASGSSKTENASEQDDEMSNDETKGTNTVEISTEENKETKPSGQKFQGDFDKDASKTEPETLDEVKDASNSEAGKNKPDSSPGQDEKKEYKEGEDALKIIEEMKDNVVIASGSVKTEDVSKPDKVSDETKGPNTVEMSTELNKETTSIDKKTEGDTFKTGPGTPDEINDASNSGGCDNHPENSPEQNGKSMEGKEEILDSEDLSKKKAVDAGPNTVEMSTELNKETTSIDKKTEGDTFKTGPGTFHEINVASNSGACDNHSENSPEQDGKSMEGKEEILDGEDLSKKKAVDVGPNTVEMSTELNKETTSIDKKTEGDTFKTGPGTPDEINVASNSGACDNHPESSPEQDGKSMEGKEEILDGEDLSKKKAVDVGPNTVEMSTELNKETTSSEKKTEGGTFKTGPGTPDEINVASNSGACDNHPENSPEQDGTSMEGKEEILDGEDLSKKKAVDSKCVSSGAGGATEDQPAVPAPSNSNSGANTIESEDGEPSDEVVSSKKEEADNSSENVDPSKIDGSSANVEHLKKFEADMVENPGASGKNKLPQTGNLEQANFVKTSNGEDENGKNADKSTVLGETKNDGDDGTPASGAGTIGENLGSDIFDNMQETVI